MAVISWTDDLSVKIQSIDEQHKKLIDMINVFYDNINKQSNEDLIARMVKHMKEYSIMHFSTEERYMVKFNYPGYEQHKKEHEDYINKVNELETKLKKGKLLVSFEITNFLKNWIKKHIQETDKQYSEFFLKNGVV